MGHETAESTQATIEQGSNTITSEALSSLVHIETGEATDLAFRSLEAVNPDAAKHLSETIQARTAAATELVETGGKLHERSVLLGEAAPRVSTTLEMSTAYLARRVESSSRSGDESDVAQTLRRTEQTTAFFAELARVVGDVAVGSDKTEKTVHIGGTRANFDLESLIQAFADVQHVTGERIYNDAAYAATTSGALTGSAGRYLEETQSLLQLETPLNGHQATADVIVPLGYGTSARVLCVSDGGDRSRDQFQVRVASTAPKAEREQQMTEGGSLAGVRNSHVA